MAAVSQLREHCASLRDADRRVQALSALIRGVEAPRATIADVLRQTTDDLHKAAAADLRLIPLANLEGPPNGYDARYRPIEELRDAAVTMPGGMFTAAEYAARLKCTTARARQELKRLDAAKPGLVQPMNVLCRGAKMYQYVPPDGPGSAFEEQQRVIRERRRNDGVDAGPVAGDLALAGGDGPGRSLLLSIKDKAIRELAREAIDDGWRLVKGSGDHPMRLVRDGRRMVPLHGSPRNSGNAVKVLRAELAR